ncbi:hypothetical protein ACQKMD_11110 [Viridibacillus sp. NPDC096237]|uniref:hypothetical protein n=1 Tax=Viridibacillus sp. NPDC096237 TaxID=3390721 RepID=UPI003CFF6CBD
MNQITYEMPSVIENNYDGFIFFTKMYQDVLEFYNTYIIFDFSRTTWFEANFSAIFASVIESLHMKKCNVAFAGIDEKIETILKKNGFYNRYELGLTVDTYNSTIPFNIFSTSNGEGFTEYLDEEVIPKINLPLSGDQIKMFKKCLQEVFENTRIHANSGFIYTCGQYFPYKKKVAFTMVDLGNTIGQNVRKKLGDDIVDHDAIDWATEFGNTTKPSKDGGIGLHFLKDRLENNGELTIISGKGYWEQGFDGIYHRKIAYHYDGTIVNLVSDLSKDVRKEVGEICF